MARAWLVGPTYRDQVYAEVGGRELCLDLYLPFWKSNGALVIYLHGGGWQQGSYKNAGALWLLERGFALASVEYRLSSEAYFPAQIHDVKAAIRWLRAKAVDFGYEHDRFGVLGVSSGGHLAMLAGTSTSNPQLEGTWGSHSEVSSRVQAVVNYYGASDLILRSRTQPSHTESPDSIVHRLLGRSPSEDEALARLASPVSHVTSQAPPLYVIHGEQDSQVLPDQALRIADVYRDAGCVIDMEIIAGAGHGGVAFTRASLRERVGDFLEAHLLRESVAGFARR